MRASEAAQLTVLLTVTLSTLAPPITANVSNVNVTPRTANMTMTTAAMETRLEIQAALMELFSANLTNQSTADFKDETQYFTAEIENIFKNSKFKESFLYTEVITFSSHLSRAFLVDFDLVFNSSYPVPHINSAITELMVAIYSNQTALPLNPCFFEHRGVTTVVPPTTLTPVSTPPMATGNTTKGSTTTISTPPGATAAGDTTKGTGTTATTPPGATATGDTTKGTAPTTASMAPSFTTTAAATSTTNTILTTPVPQNTVILFFSILWDFTLALNDRNSQEFIKLAQEVTSECNTIFQARFGSIFISTFLAKFSNGSIITALDMEFTSRSSIPPDNDIIQTFRKAAQDQSFSFPINPNIIYISRNVTTSQNTTGAAAPLSPSSPFPAMLFSLLATLLSARLFLR